MIFYRILDNKLYHVNEVKKLGFEKSEKLQIPDEYLYRQQFTVMRTAWGIGDWGIISAMPRLLKQKYPECRVYVPSRKLIKKLFNVDTTVVETIFKNNPYVDRFKDYVIGEIFHDHYRTYDSENLDISLLEQMLKFWQFNSKEFNDSQPELYWTDEEKAFGDSIIKKYVGNNEFGCLLLSDRLGTQRGKFNLNLFNEDVSKIKNILHQNNLPYFYWANQSLMAGEHFSFVNKILDMKHIDLRIQLYIKSKAKINISNQCGTNHLAARYSKCYEIQRQFPLQHNFVKGLTYIGNE